MRNRRTARMPLGLAAIMAVLVTLVAVPANAAQRDPGGTSGELRTTGDGRVRPERVPEEVAKDQDSAGIDPRLLIERYGPLRFVVDSAVAPSVAEVGSLDQAPDRVRSAGAIAFPDGDTTELVRGEVAVHTASLEELEAFLARWDGKVLEAAQSDPGSYDHLVEVNVAGADVTNLPANLLAVEADHAGQHRVSDEDTLGLLALVAQEQAAGTDVTPNWLSVTSESIADGQVSEAPTAGNVFDWTFMRQGGPHNSGVTRAWQLLESHGKLDTHHRLMFLDGGYIKNPDWPPLATVRYTDWNAAGALDCSGTSCPWHGTSVVMAAMAEVDNGYGVAGPAGPLAAEAVVVGTERDVWTWLRRLEDLVEYYRPAALNSSAGATIKAFKRASEDAASRRFRHMQEDGALIVAAAGNHGIPVDGGDLFIPCESGRVMCVGGMVRNNTTRAPGSNYGLVDSPNSVEIYGPFCTFTLKDVTNPGLNEHDDVCGTSVASPFVAGVAMLVRAANPKLTQAEVRQIINDTAHVGGLGVEVTGSRRHINALKAVAKALGAKPTVSIVSPTGGQEYGLETQFSLFATTSDYTGGTLPVQWWSSVDGFLGPPTAGPLAWGKLSEGTHTIQAFVADDLNQTASDKITITVADHDAEVHIVSPAANATLPAGKTVKLLGQSFDPDTDDALGDSEVTWTVKRNGSPVLQSTGHLVYLPENLATPGTYGVTFSGGGGTEGRTFKLVATDPNLDPLAAITSPPGNTTLLAYGGDPQAIHFAATATDPQDGTVPGTRFRWVARGATTEKVLCTGSNVPKTGNKNQLGQFKDCSSFDTTLGLEPGQFGTTVWSVELEVYDNSGRVGRDDVTVTVKFIVP